MKIGILVDQLVPGGVQKSAIEEARNLKAMGHQVTLFVLVRLGYGYQYEDLSRGLQVVFLSDYNPWPFRRAVRIPYFAFLTHLHLLNPFFVNRYRPLKKFDFLISHGTTTCITTQAINRKLKIPYLAFIWDPMLYIWDKVYQHKLGGISRLAKAIIYHYERNFLYRATIVATPSRVHQQFIRDTYHLDPLIIYPGCSAESKIGQKLGRFVLGYTRWELAKNPQLFLWLAKKLPQAQFLLAGYWTSPLEEKAFKEKIKRLRLTKRIKLASPITNEDLKKIASQSAVWLHPNFEAFGMAGLEMASLGLPIIIPKNSGVTEIFQEGKHGFFPPANDRRAFLKSLAYLLNHPYLCSQMGKEAKKMARGYTWKRHAEAVFTSIQQHYQQKKIVCLTNAFVSSKSLGGGDRFLIETIKRLPSGLKSVIILPHFALNHFPQDILPKNQFIQLKSNPFDEISSHQSIFMAYLIRTWQSIILAGKISAGDFVFSPTDFFTDVIPAWQYKKRNPKAIWIGRFFHFVPSPTERPGNLLINIVAYLMQNLSLFYLKKADVILADNSEVREKLIQSGFSSDRIFICGGGIDFSFINRYRPKITKHYEAVYLGRLHPNKGALDIAPVWELVTDKFPQAQLAVIGDGDKNTKKNIRRQVKNLRLENNIDFLGFLPQEPHADKPCVYDILKSAKVFLFLDHEAGWGLAIAEAMACKLPVVGYDLPIFGDVYHRGYQIVKKGDFKSSAQKIIQLLSSQSARTKLSQQAFRQAQQLDWKYSIDRFLQILGNQEKSFLGKKKKS